VSFVLFGGILLAPLACKMQVLKPSSDDTVRERVAALGEANRKLDLENEGLRSELATLNQDRTPEEVELEAATPKLAEVRIDSSSVVEERPDGSRQLVLRLAPSDDRARFVQIIGPLAVRVVAVPEKGGPIPLAATRFDSLQVREAWRGGFLGSAYVFKVPLASSTGNTLPPTVDVVTLFTDSRSGRTLRDEQPVRVVEAAAR
jgi:hypothetical protein